MKGLYFTCMWLTFWIKITPRFCNCVMTWIKSVIEHTSVLFCVVEHSPDCIFSVDRCNIQWCQGLGNEIITTYHHIFVIPSHYTDPDHQSDSVLYTLYTRTGLKFTTLLSQRRPNADIAPGKSIVPKTHLVIKTHQYLVCYTAVFSVVTQRSSPQMAAENRTTFLSLCVCGLTNKPIMYKKLDNTWAAGH